MANQPVYAPQAQKEFAHWERFVKREMPARMREVVRIGSDLRALTAIRKGKR